MPKLTKTGRSIGPIVPRVPHATWVRSIAAVWRVGIHSITDKKHIPQLTEESWLVRVSRKHDTTGNIMGSDFLDYSYG